ncbi:sialic acid-binding Ig-like lectin 11 isoform X3 [Gymnodraco acuticeps]|uniref:Sialic acid-binding Ig-like lectin 11 isoform X3 n=1 Tax=Gymnodraco acuticeps TaxID=8218 RepID=A0A6P8T0W4_GYMAC|nr:sialic acid-binding Ig-like lectin 11 isoform X3 [Gymnodraco acuticeps]
MATRETVCRHHRIRMFVLIWGILLSSGLTQKPSVMIPPLTEGQPTTLTCTAPGLCSGSDPKFTWTWRGAGEKDSQITGNITALKTEDLTAVTQRHSSTLTFNPSAEHHNNNVTCEVSFKNNITAEETVTLNVTYLKKLVITGVTTVKDGDDLNLTCSVESFPPSVITWTKHGSIRNLTKETKIILDNNTGTATLTIRNVTVDYSGLYVCKAKLQIPTLSTHAEVNVTFLPRIFSTSGCVVQSEVLTCVCISEGFPLPTIKWPLLDAHTEYSVTTNFSNHAVNLSITVTLKDRNYTTVECISSNDIGEVKENLNVTRKVLKQYADQHGPCEVLLWIGVAAVSLIVNVICIILMMFLWHSRKKVKPNQEDRTYMSIKKTEVSSDYDVIAQPLN